MPSSVLCATLATCLGIASTTSLTHKRLSRSKCHPQNSTRVSCTVDLSSTSQSNSQAPQRLRQHPPSNQNLPPSRSRLFLHICVLELHRTLNRVLLTTPHPLLTTRIRLKRIIQLKYKRLPVPNLNFNIVNSPHHRARRNTRLKGYPLLLPHATPTSLSATLTMTRFLLR